MMPDTKPTAPADKAVALFWRAYLLLALSILAFALCSCGVMSPQAQETAIQVLGQMRALGQITEEQYQALLQALLQAGSAHFWEQVVTAVGGAAMAYAGVQVRRKIDHSEAKKQRAQK